MIENPDHVGKTAAALLLLSRNDYKTSVKDNKITVELGYRRFSFDSEEDYMVWMLNEIQKNVEYTLAWFHDHKTTKE